MRKLFLIFLFLLLASPSFAQKKWQLSIQTWTFHTYSLLETIHKSDSLGVNYLEVYPGQKVGGNIQGLFSYNLITEDRERIKELLRLKGIKIIAIGVVDKYYYNKDNLEKFFEFASYMKIPFITAEPEWEDLDEFNRLAEKYKMKVALHCHPKPESHYWNPDSMSRAMEGRKFIGAWPDIGHWARSGVHILDGLDKVKKKLWGLHFKDVQQFDTIKTPDTLFGKGVCNLPAVIKRLKKLHFKGVISMEYEVYENNMPAMKQNKMYTEELFKQ